LARQEDGASRTPVVDYGQYAVKALALGEACDQIHHNLSEGRCIFRDHDFIKWGAGFVHEVLVLLADGVTAPACG